MTTPVVVRTLGANGQVLSEHTLQLDGEEEKRHLGPANLGQAYQTLRDWADDARATEAAWDMLTLAQKDARMRITYARLATFMDRLADLLAHQRLA